MCLSTPLDQIVCECQVGDLQPGDRFLDDQKPTRELLMVTDHQASYDRFCLCVSLRSGKVRNVLNDIKLARRSDGQLYISRYLNKPQPTVVVKVATCMCGDPDCAMSRDDD